MKVINQIIEYLYRNNSLSWEQIELLKQKGFFQEKWNDYEYDYEEDYYDYPYYEEEDLEKPLYIETRKVKRKGHRKTIQKAKSRTQDNFQIQILPSNIESDLWWQSPLNVAIDPEILKKEKKKLFGHHKEMYYKFLYTSPFYDGKFSVREYWEWFMKTYGPEELERWSQKIIRLLERFSVEQKMIKIIRPEAFFALKAQDNAQNDLGWALTLQVNSNTFLALTNYYGEEKIRKINL